MRSAICVVLALLVAACQPAARDPATLDAPDAEGVAVSLEPPAALDVAPRVIRIRLSAAGAALDPQRALFARGELGPAHLRELQRGDLSKALTERLVPSLTWRELDSGAVVIAPVSELEAGATYGVAYADPPLLATIRVAPSDAAPTLDRIWPLEGAAASSPFSVWCGTESVGSFALAARLDPDGPRGVLRSGAAQSVGANCLRFEPTPPWQRVRSAVAPPAIDVHGATVRLSPAVLEATAAAPPPVRALPCSGEEIAFGPGCADVEDDRLIARSAEQPLLWAIRRTNAADAVIATAPGDRFALTGLPPSSTVPFELDVFDLAGRRTHGVVTLTTAAPMPHLIVNEVLANPLGPEPAQEWIELVNDGSVGAALEDYVLRDSGGDTPLPAVELVPRAFALVVSDRFVEDDGVDVPPAPGTRIVRVAKLGTNGLANSGEAIELVHADVVVSRFPATPKPQAGKSVARRQPSAPDGMASSFAIATPSPGQGNNEGLP